MVFVEWDRGFSVYWVSVMFFRVFVLGCDFFVN